MIKNVKISRQKVIAIVGPTASGKSGIAIEIARRFNGEIISADSRQVYRGLDVASGKVTKKEMLGIPHHLLDVADPKRRFSAAMFQKKALRVIADICKRGKTPVLCGGTGFYIQAVIDGVIYPEVPPNAKLRTELSSNSIETLGKLLKKLDPRRYREIEKQNPHRLIRAIEIATKLGSVPRLAVKPPKLDILQIGLALPDSELKKRIELRTTYRMKRGMVAEAKRLRAAGISRKRMKELGLEYGFLSDYLDGKFSKDELIEKINTGDWHYAKRQMTWFRRDKRIQWFDPKECRKIEKIAESFLTA